jgi:hypothetical protein
MTRSARSLTHLAVSVLAAASFLIGCTTPGSEARPRSEVRKAAKRAVLAPTNFDQLTPTQLEPGLEKTDALTKLYLKHRGLEVKRLSIGRFREQWSEAVGDAEIATDDPGFGQAAARVLELISPDDPDAVLIVPSIVYRVAEMHGSAARWDGVTDRVIFEGLASEWNFSFDQPTRCVSIWIRVFDRSGEVIQDRYGGVELPWKIVMLGDQTKGNTYHYNYDFADRDDLFQDPAKIARAIKIAMDPYIPRKR